MKRVCFCSIFSHLIVILAVISNSVSAQSSSDLVNCPLRKSHLFSRESPHFLQKGQLNSLNTKERNCIQTGRIIGALAGSTMGLLTIYFRARGVSGVEGPVWKSYLTSIPSIIIGAYVGARTTEWATKQIMKAHPNVAKDFLKGGAYGALDGALTLTSSLILLFLVGHYTGTIKINSKDSFVNLKILEISTLGGVGYGGIFGAGIGAAYGTGISLYLRF